MIVIAYRCQFRLCIFLYLFKAFLLALVIGCRELVVHRLNDTPLLVGACLHRLGFSVKHSLQGVCYVNTFLGCHLCDFIVPVCIVLYQILKVAPCLTLGVYLIGQYVYIVC